MRRNSYDPYHGRNRTATVLKVLIAVLLVLLVVGVAALFFLEPYMVYSADGMRLELPFFQKGEEEPSLSQPPVVVSTPEPTPEPEPEFRFQGMLLDRTALYDGTAQTQAEQAGATAVIFDMKADDGSLGYISQLELARDTQVSASDPAINAAIQLLNSGELHTVARVSCFRDNTVPREHSGLSVPKSSGSWRDPEGFRWLSPASAEARSYVAGLCRELAGLGFDEILLDNWGFPTRGKLDSIRDGDNYPEDRTAPLEEFLREVKDALAEYPDVTLSMVSGAAVLSGEDDGSGQTADLLERYAGRVLVPEGEKDLPALGEVSVVPVAAEPGSATEQWAVLTAPAN